jgi:hypothetical protein
MSAPRDPRSTRISLMLEINLPSLREIPPSQFDSLGHLPSLVIKTDDDVTRWTTARSYHEFDLFLRRLTESVVGVELTETESYTSVVRHRILFY